MTELETLNSMLPYKAVESVSVIGGGLVARCTSPFGDIYRIGLGASTEKDVMRWIEGALIQDVFPYLTASEREIMITGISDWDSLGPEEDV